MHILASLISLLLLALGCGFIAFTVRGQWDRIVAALQGQEMPKQATAEIVRLGSASRGHITASTFRTEPLPLAA
jgi:hypothetical protein